MSKTSSSAQPARLMLILPADIEPDHPVIAALAEAEIAAAIVPVGEGHDERAALKRLKPLIAAIQAAGTAALIAGADDLVGKSGADGLHVEGRAAREAVERFRPAKIVGAGALRSRDLAMEAGETGADYVMFGEPGTDGGHPPLESVLERARWWAEVFITPAVAYAPTLDDMPAVAATGVEFVALGAAVFSGPDPVAALARAADLLGRAA